MEPDLEEGTATEVVSKWTPFGDTLRKIRQQKGLLLIHMAKAAGVTSGFLSLVETGKKPIPERLISSIVCAFDLDAKAEAELRESAALSANEYRIHLGRSAGHFDRTVAHALQTGFAKMSKKNKEKILKLLEEG